MSTTLEVTGNHVVYDRSAWFLWVIMSSSLTLPCLPSVKKQKRDFFLFCSMYNKTSASADNPYLDLDYSGYHENLIQ